jgi:hypothetical protein
MHVANASVFDPTAGIRLLPVRLKLSLPVARIRNLKFPITLLPPIHMPIGQSDSEDSPGVPFENGTTGPTYGVEVEHWW